MISSAGIQSVQDVLATMREQELRGQEASENELPYVAPEVLMGGAPNPAADVFTIGVLAYQMVTGTVPFKAASLPELIGQMLQTKPAPPAGDMPRQCARRHPESDRQHAGEPLRVGGRVRARARMSQADRRYRPDIDGLRALAVGVVMIFHAFPAAAARRLRRRRRVLRDLRLSRSPASSSSARLTGRFSFAHFYARRIRRIFPALGVVLAAVLVARLVPALRGRLRARSAITPPPARRSCRTSRSGGKSSYFDVAAELKPLLHLWSLGVEEQFYLVWPVLLVLAARWRRGPLVATLRSAPRRS